MFLLRTQNINFVEDKKFILLMHVTVFNLEGAMGTLDPFLIKWPLAKARVAIFNIM